MKVLKSWLKEYVDIKLTNDELVSALDLSGTEVEKVETLDERVIAVKILAIKRHPNADRLQIATVTDGTKEMEIVCGAPNIEKGQIVPLAQVGVKLGEIEIAEAEIRGVKSSGMLCSERELGLGDDHSGIKILDETFELGKPIANKIETDPVFELDITPNRGDCLSHIGIAREISAIQKNSIRKEPIKLDMISEQASHKISVDIKDTDLCSQYYARVIQNVKIGESPDWLKKRLLAVGAKPINNIVDVTNYIMLDLGHPLHAFDYDKIGGKKIIVRRAKNNEEIISLDGEKRLLDKDVLVIADADEPVAIAGVMGGFDSEITDSTRTVVLEAAVFDRKSIRKTAKKLNMMTDASYRFERGIDEGLTEYVINKAAKLIAEVSGGLVLSGIVKSGSKPTDKFVKINYKKINQLLGTVLEISEINSILKSLGFEVENDQAKVPTWRHDIEVWQDVAEEIGRIYGYDKITLSPVPKVSAPKKTDYYKKEYIKDILVESGFIEVYNYSFMPEEDLKAINIDSKDLLEVANPLQPENKYLRKTLVPGLLKTIAKNSAFDPVAIFEIGNVFTKTIESNHLAIAASGKNSRKLIDAAVEALASKLKLPSSTFTVSEMKREDLVKFKIRKEMTCITEIDLVEVLKKAKFEEKSLKLSVSKKNIHYRPISKYPSVTRDLAFLLDKTIKSDEIIDLIYKQSDLINRVELFDEFASDKFGVGKKNLAYHIDLQHQTKTLTDKEADEVINQTVQVITKNFKAKLRDY